MLLRTGPSPRRSGFGHAGGTVRGPAVAVSCARFLAGVWDEIVWFSQQPANARKNWLRCAWNWLREHGPDASVQMPGMQIISGVANAKRWCEVNQPDASTLLNSFGHEQTICIIWSG